MKVDQIKMILLLEPDCLSDKAGTKSKTPIKIETGGPDYRYSMQRKPCTFSVTTRDKVNKITLYQPAR